MTDAALSPFKALAGIAGALWLTGCANGEISPLGVAAQALLPGREDDALQARAEQLPFASIMLKSEDLEGLVVLGAVSGDSTFWPAGNRMSLALYQDGLQATAGMPRDLLSLHYTAAEAHGGALEPYPWRWPAPPTYRVESRWQARDGTLFAAEARGELRCGEAAPTRLPLGSLPLQTCHETLYWSTGEVSHSSLWRDPESLRLWAAELTPWPQGPTIGWQVARPWW